jgi:hypothetical protein
VFDSDGLCVEPNPAYAERVPVEAAGGVDPIS